MVIGRLALQITARVQFAALVDAVTIHLIKQCPQAHAEPLRSGPAVATRLLQGSRNCPTLREAVEAAERQAIAAALAAAEGNRRAAAQRLGVSLRTLFYKMDRYGID